MPDYNPNTVSAYQSYASSMTAGGGGRNASGLGSRTSTASMTTAPSGSVDFTTINPSTGQQKKVATIDYGSLQTEYGNVDAPAPITPAVIYHSAATAMSDAGSVLTPPMPMANAMSLYSMPKMAEQVSDYVYRADRDMAVREAISGAQQEEQDSVDAAIKSINKAITQGKTDAEIAETFLNDMGGMGNDKPDETGGFGVPGVTLKDVTDTQQGLMTNPQPLYDFAEEMSNPSITTTELPPITQDQKEKLGAKLREASDKGDLSSVMNQLAQDSKVQLSSAVTNFIEGAETQVASNDIDPFTGKPFGGDELGFTDVSPAQEAPDQLGLMARSRVPTGSIEDAVREAYNLEEPAVEAEAPAETTETEDTTTSTDFATLTIGDTSESVAASDHLTNTFDAFEDVEGDYNHVDGRGFFTMPYGVVPDNGTVKKADGTTFNPRGSHGYTTATAGSVDTSEATHTVTVQEGNKTKNYTVKRSDYDSDEAFAKGVLGLYNREAAKKYGSGFDSLPTKAKETAIDIAWNGGVGAVGWKSVKAALKETTKENPKTKTLFGFTVNFRSGTKYPRGLFKRRLIQYNKIANEADKAATYTTEAVMSGGVRTGTKYIANRSDGTVIGSWTYVDKEDKPNTAKNEKRVASTEKLEANVSVN